MNPDLKIWQLLHEAVELLRTRKLATDGTPYGRLYAIAITDLEKLISFIGFYVMPDVLREEEVA